MADEATQAAIDTPIQALIDPRLRGWKIKSVWPGLFSLHVKGTAAQATVLPELQRVLNRKHRGHSSGDELAPKIERALFLLATGSMSENRSSFGWRDFEKSVYKDLSETIGKSALAILSAQTEAKAELAETELLAIFKRAVSGVVRTKFPKRARGRGEVCAKEVLAIEEARILCEHLRRLPTKDEVRERLEQIGISFAPSSKDILGKWRNLFDRAGLSDLPDSIP